VQGLEAFAHLPSAALDALTSRAVVRRYSAGTVLFREGTTASGLHIIVDGSVRVLRTSAGRRRVVHTESRGGALGEVALFDGAPYPATAIADGDVRCVFVSAQALDHAMRSSPEVARLFMRRLAARTRELIHRLDAFVTVDTTGRLAGYLAARVARDHSPVVAVTQNALAEELGTVREVVVRSLRMLRTAGAIRSAGRGRIEVIDLARLERGSTSLP
jgi:CRP/FNR family transcriptional regulator, cyclic AMP receptor protein